jgi:multiple sugar transport system permease protein
MNSASAAMSPNPAAVYSPPSWWSRHQLQIVPWLFLTPALIMFTTYVLIPIVWSIGYSFYDWDGLGKPVFIGLKNYIDIWGDDDFWAALKNTVVWLFGFLLAIPAGLGLALLLNQKVFGIRLSKALFFFPFVIAQAVIGLVFTWFYNPDSGILNYVLSWFGFAPVAILADERYVTFGLIAAALYPQIAYCMILYLTGLNNLRPDLIEAARLEGSKGWHMLWNIVLPQLRPATFIAVVVTVIGSLRSFDMIDIMTQGGPYNTSTVLAYYMYQVSIDQYRMGYGAAVATVLFAIMSVYIVFILYRVYQQEKAAD